MVVDMSKEYWGFSPFLNFVIDECMEMASSGQKNDIGTVGI